MYLNIVNRLEAEEDCKVEYIFVEVLHVLFILLH